MQKYLRQQQHRNSYDLMGSVIDLLKAYCPNPRKPGGMPRKNYVNIKRCLETLTEFVQGPCKENQISLIDGKFFEVAEGILGVSLLETEMEPDPCYSFHHRRNPRRARRVRRRRKLAARRPGGRCRSSRSRTKRTTWRNG